MKLRLLTFSIFALLALPAAAQAQVFANPSPMATPYVTSNPENPFTPYPSEISVAGTQGALTDVNVTLQGFGSNGSFYYTELLLVAPDGTAVTLLTNAGGTAQNINLTFDQQAASTIGETESVPNGSNARFQPTVIPFSGRPVFPAPAVVPSNISPDLNRLSGHSANGVWKLFGNHKYSYSGYNNASITGGWSLELTTTGDVTAPAFSRPAVSGKTIGFDLTEAASVQFRVDRISKGVKVKSKCLAPKKGRKGKSCSRYVPLPGGIDTIGVAGINSFAWNGRIGSKKLAPGKYRLTGIAKDAAGNQSPPQTFTVTIKKPKKKKN